MKMKFILENFSGQELAICFAKAIKEPGVGEDETGYATLSADGFTWITTPSRFEYQIENPREIFEGNALRHHELEKVKFSDASILAETYRLLHMASRENKGAFWVCLAAVQSARKITEFLQKQKMDEPIKVYAGGSKEGNKYINTFPGDPAVYIVFHSRAGEKVTVEIQLHPTGPESTTDYIVWRANGWIDKLATV